MADLDQMRRNAQVADLLTESFKLFDAGQFGRAQAAMDKANEIDALAVSVITGGMRIGEVPRPDQDFAGWADYVTGIHDALARAEEESTDGQA